jgi:hypothetical protein
MGGEYDIVCNFDKICCVAALWTGNPAGWFPGRDMYFIHGKKFPIEVISYFFCLSVAQSTGLTQHRRADAARNFGLLASLVSVIMEQCGQAL